MPLTPDPYTFPALPKTTFKGLPGLLADALPDKFGDKLINTWLATQERTIGYRQPPLKLSLSALLHGSGVKC